MNALPQPVARKVSTAQSEASRISSNTNLTNKKVIQIGRMTTSPAVIRARKTARSVVHTRLRLFGFAAIASINHNRSGQTVSCLSYTAISATGGVENCGQKL